MLGCGSPQRNLGCLLGVDRILLWDGLFKSIAWGGGFEGLICLEASILVPFFAWGFAWGGFAWGSEGRVCRYYYGFFHFL